ncbi:MULTISPECIES: hypothetical protein [Photorhabdus]|nr:hypothetical protein [Photorhabdus asymbiotica]
MTGVSESSQQSSNLKDEGYRHYTSKAPFNDNLYPIDFELQRGSK